jgi:uncharacterized protein (DUF2235 family)
MPNRRIIACLDGTWAKPEDLTNITWIAENCRSQDNMSVLQHVGYFPGVGTIPIERYRGGIFGYGLSRQLLDAYRFIRGHWRDERDEIFIFGFSRGAFAARSLANFIGMAGCLDTDSKDILRHAYKGWYRNARDPKGKAQELAERSRKIVQPHIRSAEVSFLGVFDTVGSLGSAALLNNDGLIDILKKFADLQDLEERIHDVTLRNNVARACHAVAIDEDLEPFAAILWPAGSRSLERQEVWFAGGHGEVGGGHLGSEDNRNLAKVPLHWMMEKAIGAGMVLKPNAMTNLAAQADPLAPQHNAPPRIDPWLSSVLELSGRRRPRTIPADAAISKSVQARLGKIIEIRDVAGNVLSRQPYQPINLPH